MTNLVLNVLVLVALVAASWPVLRRLRPWPLLATAVLLVVLTAVFDTLMIRVGLYEYQPGKILGVHVGWAPVEDFAYSLAAALGVPVLWTLIGRRGPARPAEPDASGRTPPGVEDAGE